MYRKNFFVQPVKNHLRTYDNIRKINIGQGHDCATVCSLDYSFFKRYCKLIARDLQLDADPKATQQVNFTGNLDRDGNTQIFFIIKKVKETVLDFS